MKQQKKIKSEIRSHGVRLLLSNHKNVRKLKKEYVPSNHGHKVWPTSWLLIDYLNNAGVNEGKRILDLACGWGLSGVFCAKILKSEVTWVDSDEEVYPFLELLAEKNKVEANFLPVDIDKVGRQILRDIDIIITSDICFCDSLIDPLRRLINRAKNASVSQIYISDPGRWPFYDLTEFFIHKKEVELLDWEITKPVNVQGKIFKLSY